MSRRHRTQQKLSYDQPVTTWLVVQLLRQVHRSGFVFGALAEAPIVSLAQISLGPSGLGGSPEIRDIRRLGTRFFERILPHGASLGRTISLIPRAERELEPEDSDHGIAEMIVRLWFRNVLIHLSEEQGEDVVIGAINYSNPSVPVLGFLQEHAGLADHDCRDGITNNEWQTIEELRATAAEIIRWVSSTAANRARNRRQALSFEVCVLLVDALQKIQFDGDKCVIPPSP